MRQNSFGEREIVSVGRQLHDHQRAFQLLLHLRDAAEDSGKAARKESGKELRTSGQQKTCLFSVSLP